ncbi:MULTISPECIES: chemotaxis protein CheB [unclassified Cupriavidus]|jgi:two-component system chemotaxis response regulator CheB|uniref:chemotaxis protein CheB n=1 Tax=unclassified Cupriavidus TaxID=2640874 RepID=UPI001C002B3A|nr:MULTISPECIES: chemotaxis protein CheB [unclassified Cupriavidus]MCA3187221.1 chemotaxis protein CheB [Cupriavidus sp.]MCA3194549.1 chemotaxis protein CheB [Cupriavidus sp.]MCA3200154.1 chemotaxis protein CheB [Cupriavidus sp.]MCA3204200.1 chemotaxis protein CheB [Cupriavidus sp.]MCA3209336.1 chemotaxis protein CheB [Cupriavidus sp.]
MRRDIVVVAASRGSLPVLKTLVEGLGKGLDVALLVVLHIGRHRSILPELLSKWGPFPAYHPQDGEAIQHGRIYVAPPDRHMVVRDETICLLETAPENFCRPAADPLFRAASAQYTDRVIGMVLSGELDDGAAGLAAVGARGGYRIVQDPDSCEAPSMPRSAIAAAGADAIVTPDGLADALGVAIDGAASRKGPIMIDREDLDREKRIGDSGIADPAELDAIAERSALTCPNCHGVLWRLRDDRPLRFRCHTGHAYSALSLDAANAQSAADAIWGALRAVHERIIFAQERQQWARRVGDETEAALEQSRIDENEKLAELLRAAAGTHLS